MAPVAFNRWYPVNSEIIVRVNATMDEFQQRAPRPSRIDEELVCADALKHTLESQFNCRVESLAKIDDDPPDFSLQIDGEDFFAEVTSIVDDEMFHANCRNLANHIESQCIQQHVLFGSYALVVRRKPHVPKQSSTAGKDLLSSALSYVTRTAQHDAAEAFEIWRDPSGFLQLTKTSPTGRNVGVVWFGAVKREHEVIDELTALMQRAVTEKIRKLSHRNLPMARTMLVFYDAYGFAEPKHAARALQRVTGYAAFHSIFWAASFSDRRNETYPEAPGRSGFFIYSSVPSWEVNLRNGTQGRN